MQFRDNDLRALTPSKQVNASIIHRLEIAQGTGHPGTIYSGVGLKVKKFCPRGQSPFYSFMSGTALAVIGLKHQNI